MHWSSKILVRYKRNAITGELNQAKQIVPDFNKELKRLRQKYRNAGFSLKSINETFCNFERGKEEIIIPEWLFEERKSFSVRFPHSPANEKFSKAFTRKVENFTNDIHALFLEVVFSKEIEVDFRIISRFVGYSHSRA